MARYKRINWQARRGDNLNRFRKENETASHVELVSDATVTQLGTPLSARNLNTLDAGVSYAVNNANRLYPKASTGNRGGAGYTTGIVIQTPIVHNSNIDRGSGIQGVSDTRFVFGVATDTQLVFYLFDTATYPPTQVDLVTQSGGVNTFSTLTYWKDGLWLSSDSVGAIDAYRLDVTGDTMTLTYLDSASSGFAGLTGLRYAGESELDELTGWQTLTPTGDSLFLAGDTNTSQWVALSLSYDEGTNTLSVVDTGTRTGLPSTGYLSISPYSGGGAYALTSGTGEIHSLDAWSEILGGTPTGNMRLFSFGSTGIGPFAGICVASNGNLVVLTDSGFIDQLDISSLEVSQYRAVGNSLEFDISGRDYTTSIEEYAPLRFVTCERNATANRISLNFFTLYDREGLQKPWVDELIDPSPVGDTDTGGGTGAVSEASRVMKNIYKFPIIHTGTVASAWEVVPLSFPAVGAENNPDPPSRYGTVSPSTADFQLNADVADYLHSLEFKPILVMKEGTWVDSSFRIVAYDPATVNPSSDLNQTSEVLSQRADIEVLVEQTWVGSAGLRSKGASGIDLVISETLPDLVKNGWYWRMQRYSASQGDEIRDGSYVQVIAYELPTGTSGGGGGGSILPYGERVVMDIPTPITLPSTPSNDLGGSPSIIPLGVARGGEYVEVIDPYTLEVVTDIALKVTIVATMTSTSDQSRFKEGYFLDTGTGFVYTQGVDRGIDTGTAPYQYSHTIEPNSSGNKFQWSLYEDASGTVTIESGYAIFEPVRLLDI